MFMCLVNTFGIIFLRTSNAECKTFYSAECTKIFLIFVCWISTSLTNWSTRKKGQNLLQNFVAELKHTIYLNFILTTAVWFSLSGQGIQSFQTQFLIEKFLYQQTQPCWLVTLDVNSSTYITTENWLLLNFNFKPVFPFRWAWIISVKISHKENTRHLKSNLQKVRLRKLRFEKVTNRLLNINSVDCRIWSMDCS